MKSPQNNSTHGNESEKNQENSVKCLICGKNYKQITTSHLKSIHGITIKEYQKRFGTDPKLLFRPDTLKEMSERVQGSKNPAYQHGGRLSPFSNQFIHYQNNTAKYTKDDVKKKQAKTVKEHPENQSTKLEYWLNKGYNQEEARILLSERQQTFTLAKCIERDGNDKGTKIWQDRQDRWQATLNNKSDEEKAEINRKKVTGLNYRTIWNIDYNRAGIFYVLRLINGYLKIGVTSNKKGVYGRYSKDKIDRIFIIQKFPKIHDAFCLEQLCLRFFNNKRIEITENNKFGGWTECFEINNLHRIEKYIQRLLKFTTITTRRQRLETFRKRKS